MSDMIRGRSSTWSGGAPLTNGDPEASRTFEYGDASLTLHSTNASANNAATSLDQGTGNSGSGTAANYHCSPVTSSHTAAELSSQEFQTNRRLLVEKTPESTNSDYNQNYFTNTASSPSRNSREWNTGSGGAGGFQSSNFSALSVAASSPFSHQPEGGSAGLLTPCGGYGGSSPYTNGSCCPESKITCQQPGLHSGSPSSVGSQLSVAQPNIINASGAISANSVGSTTAGSTSAPNSAKRPARRNPWGSETYSDLIAKAIESYPEKQATLQQIYDYISTNYTYFRERSDPPASAGWKNSIRHNLSLHDKFVKCPKASESSKSSYWRLNANSLNRPYVRRRTCSLDAPGSAGSVSGKKTKSRLGAGGPSSAAKRAAQMATAGGSGVRGDTKTGAYGGDDILGSLPGRSARSHLGSLPSGIASAFSIPGGDGGGVLGIKQEPTNNVNPWSGSNSGFLTDRKPTSEELSALCKMHGSDSVSSSNLSLMSGAGSSGGGYEFQIPRAPPSSSARSSFSSGIGSDRGSSFFSPPQPSRYQQAFSHEQRYGSICDASPTYDQLTGILTGSAECLDGVSDGADAFLRGSSDDPHQLHHHHHHHQHPPPTHAPPPPTNSHLHNLLMCGDAGPTPASMMHGGSDQLLSSQDAMELRISLEIANRVKSGDMSAVSQWAAVAASAARTVENGV
uniref:Forkhead box protein O n=1 Tax=Mesocestoides corti TaxID=53468 RepID=A0A5K3EQC1_MESCO